MISSTKKIASGLSATHNHSPSCVQVIPKFVSKEDRELVSGYTAQLNHDLCGSDEVIKFYAKIHMQVTTKLFRVLCTMKDCLPYKRPTLRVISLGSGTPNDSLALKILLDLHNPTCSLHYTGIDIDAENNAIEIAEYKNFSGINIITADGSDPKAIKQALITNNIFPPNGYDIIFLRHPNILSKDGDVFKKMLREVIPFLANEKSTVFISAFNIIEMQTIEGCLDLPCYQSPPQNHYLTVEGCFSMQNENGFWLEPERHTLIKYCSGFSLGLRKDAAHQKLLEVIQRIDSSDKNSETILKAIHSRQYNLAVRNASAKLQLKWLTILLNFENDLSIDINEVSTSKDRTALDWASMNKSTLANYQATVDLLIKHGAKRFSQLEIGSGLTNRLKVS